MYVQLSNDNRILATADYNCFPEDSKKIEFDFPKDFDFNYQQEFLIVDGKLVESESDETKRYKENLIQIAERGEFLSTAPNIIAEQDDAICSLYEENLALKSTADDVDEAICYLYEQLTEGNING